MSMEKFQQLINEEKFEEARELILKILDEDPNNKDVLLEAGFLHDKLGYTPQAITFYNQALENGIEGEKRKELLLSLGSSYRAVGLYEQARETLEIGMSDYPNYTPFYIFFAMTLYNLGDTDLAMEILITKLLETTNDEDVLKYKNALSFYASRLDETFN